MATSDPGPIDAFARGCAALLGEAQVVREADALGRYSVDFWGQHRGVAAVAVRPGSTGDVAAVVRLAREHRVPIVPQSGNTGLVHGGIPDGSGGQAVLSLERMDRVRHLDPGGDHLVAEAGCVLAKVQEAAAGVGRLFPLSLGSEGSCRIGGNLATNAGGVSVLRYGMARQLVLGLEVVLASGEVWDGLRALRKDNTGYDLKQLFVGSEGTLGIVTAAALRLVPAPRERVTLWLGIDRPEAAVELLHLLQAELGELLSSVELISSFGVEAAVAHLPGVRRPLARPHPWHLLVEVAWSFPEGLRARVEAALERDEGALVADGTLAESEAQRAGMWRIREGQSEATRGMGATVRGDVTVPVPAVPELIRRMAAWASAAAPEATAYPFGHVGDGNLHFNYVVPEAEAERLKPLLLGRLYDEVTALRGSISAEHGIGRLKRAELGRRKSTVELRLMGALKRALDPEGLLNPGVIVEDPR